MLLEGKRKETQQRAIKTLWTDDKLTNLGPKTGLVVLDYVKRWASRGCPGRLGKGG